MSWHCGQAGWLTSLLFLLLTVTLLHLLSLLVQAVQSRQGWKELKHLLPVTLVLGDRTVQEVKGCQ